MKGENEGDVGLRTREGDEYPEIELYLEWLAARHPAQVDLIREQIQDPGQRASLAASLRASTRFPAEAVQAEQARQREFVERLLEHRKFLGSKSSEMSNALDKLLVTLATGTVGLSIVFIQQLGIGPLRWLVGAWALLGTCVVLIAVSMALASVAIQHQIEAIDEQVTNPGSFLAGIRGASGIPKQWASRWTVYLTYGGFAAMVLGIAAFLTFAAITIAAPIERDDGSAPIGNPVEDPHAGGSEKGVEASQATSSSRATEPAAREPEGIASGR